MMMIVLMFMLMMMIASLAKGVGAKVMHVGWMIFAMQCAPGPFPILLS
jgi:hypothetical protein